MNLMAVFLTGLTTGGLSCLAMQGGLLASVIANQKEQERARLSFDQLDWMPVGLFLITKLIAHTLLGFLLGWLGSQVEFSLTVRLIFQGIAAAFMLATAANLLDVHPIFKYVVFQPPKFIQKLLRNSTKSKAFFTPALLGLMTIFIPCGITQAMEVLAITSGSPFQGALIMFFFVLGTSPLFAIVGIATARLSEKFRNNFMKLAAALLIFLGLSSINGILKVTQPINYLFSDQPAFSENADVSTSKNKVQKITITVNNNGYAPKNFKVTAGIPVELTLQTKDTYSCASWFVFKAFNIKMELGPTDSQTATFTPTKKGKYTFSCSMGMYSGVMEVL